MNTQRTRTPKRRDVSADGDTRRNGAASAVPPDARTHREAFMAFVVSAAEPWHREHLGHLYRSWVTWNDDYFGGGMVPPYLMLAEPGTPRALGDYSATSCFGGIGQIRIRPSLVTGRHRALKPGPEFAEGRRRFVEDAALHESLHAFCYEVLQQPEASYKGHGPTFAGECNRIGEALGLPPVRPAKARGRDRDLPSCAFWPHNVRPAGYYLGALREAEPGGRGRAGPGRDPDAPPEFDTLVMRAGVALDNLWDFLLHVRGPGSPLSPPEGGPPTEEAFAGWLRASLASGPAGDPADPLTFLDGRAAPLGALMLFAHFAFGLRPPGTPKDVAAKLDRVFRKMCKDFHPDRGGTDAAMGAVNEMYDRLRAALGFGQDGGGG
jgi:hypothetical protein